MQPDASRKRYNIYKKNKMTRTQRLRLIKRSYLVKPASYKHPYDKKKKGGMIEIVSSNLKDVVGQKVKVIVYRMSEKIKTKKQK